METLYVLFCCICQAILLNSSTSINPAIQEDRMQKPLVIFCCGNGELNVNWECGCLSYVWASITEAPFSLFQISAPSLAYSHFLGSSRQTHINNHYIQTIGFPCISCVCTIVEQRRAYEHQELFLGHLGCHEARYGDRADPACYKVSA